MVRYFILLNLLVITIPSLAQINLQKGLVACYSFSGHANDSSGNNNHGIVHGATLAPDRTGKSNSAYFFDGINDYIELPPAQFKNDAFTYSVWISAQIPQRKVASGIISIGDSIDARSNGLQLDIPADPNIPVIDFQTTSDAPGLPVNARGSVVKALREWYHLVCTRNSNVMEVYIDGEEWNPALPTVPVAPRPYYGDHTTARIGVHCKYIITPFAQPFLGRIDDVAIYNRALSAAEVKALYQQGLVCTYNPPIITRPTVADVDICGGSTANLSASGGEKYRWYDAEDGALIFEGNPMIIPDVPETTSYYVSNLTARGESESIKVTVNVLTNPIIRCDFPESILVGEEKIYTATVTGGSVPFSFDFRLDADEKISTANAQVIHVYNTTGTFTTGATVTDGLGCSATCSGMTIVEEPLIPNIITPDGDVYNQVFTAYRKEGSEYRPYSGTGSFAMHIYNRWGKETFRSDNPQKVWEAANAPAGIYSYAITIGTRNYKGLLQVIK